jgi:hypothetical protein
VGRRQLSVATAGQLQNTQTRSCTPLHGPHDSYAAWVHSDENKETWSSPRRVNGCSPHATRARSWLFFCCAFARDRRRVSCRLCVKGNTERIECLFEYRPMTRIMSRSMLAACRSPQVQPPTATTFACPWSLLAVMHDAHHGPFLVISLEPR